MTQQYKEYKVYE